MHKAPALLACLLLGVAARLPADDGLKDMPVPAEVVVEGTVLMLNGAGIRSVPVLLIPVDAYMASFYAPAPLRSEQKVLDSPGPLLFTFRFLAAVSEDKVADAWIAQFEASNTHSYPWFEQDLQAFSGFFGAIPKGGTQKVALVGNETRAYEGDELKGVVRGRDFQRSFLSLWFGAKPVEPELKQALLGI